VDFYKNVVKFNVNVAYKMLKDTYYLSMQYGIINNLNLQIVLGDDNIFEINKKIDDDSQIFYFNFPFDSDKDKSDLFKSIIDDGDLNDEKKDADINEENKEKKDTDINEENKEKKDIDINEWDSFKFSNFLMMNDKVKDEEVVEALMYEDNVIEKKDIDENEKKDRNPPRTRIMDIQLNDDTKSLWLCRKGPCFIEWNPSFNGPGRCLDIEDYLGRGKGKNYYQSTKEALADILLDIEKEEKIIWDFFVFNASESKKKEFVKYLEFLENERMNKLYDNDEDGFNDLSSRIELLKIWDEIEEEKEKEAKLKMEKKIKEGREKLFKLYRRRLLLENIVLLYEGTRSSFFFWYNCWYAC